MKFAVSSNHGTRAIPAVPAFCKRALAAAALAALTACASGPNRSADVAPPAPTVVSMDEWIGRGDAAAREGDHQKARDAWRAAARDYPTAKQPWVKLSEDYFNTADYGNAVLTAQEALQRDPRDRTANSVLAVSGLRITAGSVAALRDDGIYPVGSRTEAISLTRSLREALGEPVLVPPPEAAGTKKRVARPAPRPATAVVDASSAANPPSAGNPLNKLK